MQARPWARAGVETLLFGAAAVEALTTVQWATPLESVMAVLATMALLVRQRWPLVALLATLPAFTLGLAILPGLVTLYAVAVRERRRIPLVLAGTAVFVLRAAPWWGWAAPNYAVISLVYAALYAAAPMALGMLVRTRGELTARLADLERAQETEQRMLANAILRDERAHIAREMHDVVSHQVSLIAVQAGALQVSATDAPATQAARTIRNLAVRTLDELRTMVSLLRADDQRQGSAPQPTTADIPALLTESGIPTDAIITLPDDLPLPVQRAIYRTLQESLTNIRKHAPGATASIRASADSKYILLTISNPTPRSVPASLHTAGHGLIGLRERAELLGGTLETRSGTSFRLALTLPR